MIKIFTSDELYSFLHQDDYDKFSENLNDLRSRIKYFDFGNRFWRDDFYVCKIVDGQIVGVLNYCVTKNNPTFQGHNHFISYVSIDPKFQNQGIMTELILVWNEVVKRKDKGICGCSGFTQSGFDYLRPKLIELGVECEDRISF